MTDCPIRDICDAGISNRNATIKRLQRELAESRLMVARLALAGGGLVVALAALAMLAVLR